MSSLEPRKILFDFKSQSSTYMCNCAYNQLFMSLEVHEGGARHNSFSWIGVRNWKCSRLGCKRPKVDGKLAIVIGINLIY